MSDGLLRRYAELVVEVGANVQPGQDVAIIAGTSATRLVRAIAATAYDRGARFVDPWYFDPYVKRIRAERAAEDSLEYVPPWYGERVRQLGERRGARIHVTPLAPPGLMAGVTSERVGRDLLPLVPERFEANKTTNWCAVPWPSPGWAQVVHPELEPEAALAALIEDITYVLRLDEADPAAAWRSRFAELDCIARKLSDARLAALRFRGPGTDLTVGLFATSRFATLSGWRTADGLTFTPNLPSEEILTTPDPSRTEGVVASTKPLELSGTLVHGLRLEFERGRAVSIEAEAGADAVRACIGKDDGAARLGEVALVDRDGRIGKTGRVFYDTLLDENTASHLALGNAYHAGVGDADRSRINRSSIHVDFMIGSESVDVAGITADGSELSLLVGGAWQF